MTARVGDSQAGKVGLHCKTAYGLESCGQESRDGSYGDRRRPSKPGINEPEVDLSREAGSTDFTSCGD